jgi:predicted ATP-grasp superfamily ATP-dependent carboligase
LVTGLDRGKPLRLFVYEHVSAGGLGADAPESLRREGRAMLQAIAEDFALVPGVHVTTVADAPASQAFRARVVAADATLVIAPEFDGILLDRSQWVIEAGRRLLGSLPEPVRLAGDKLATHLHWHAQGVRSPRTMLAGGEPPPFAPPWLCKPQHGAGSQEMMLVRDARAWAEWPGRQRIVQQYVSGVAASVAFLIGPQHCVALQPALQQLTDDGQFLYRGGRVPLPPSLCDRALRLGRAALHGIDGLQGYVGVDLVLGAADDGSEDYAIEINPRLTTSYIGLRRLCRDNLAQAWLDVLDGHDVRPEWRDGVVEFDADGTVRE